MQDKHLYEYAVIRVVPRVEREEFLNIGVVLYCARPRFLQALFVLDKARLGVFLGRVDGGQPDLRQPDRDRPDLSRTDGPLQRPHRDQPDLRQLAEYLFAFERICRGDPDGGPISRLTPAERFRWLTAARSTVLQTSRVHPGLCTDPGETLARLYNQLVL